MKSNLDYWIEHISRPQKDLGNFSVCPFAKGADFEIIETDGSDISPPPWDFELIIYQLPNDLNAYDVIEIAKEYNKIYQDMIFLPDPKDRHTEINGVQTNNGRYNLILCQWRDNLNKAREKLMNTQYYEYWGDKYLKEILDT